jgi:hypothetical protein
MGHVGSWTAPETIIVVLHLYKLGGMNNPEGKVGMGNT